jgi:concentrative nucleoside transporter, CNT family
VAHLSPAAGRSLNKRQRRDNALRRDRIADPTGNAMPPELQSLLGFCLLLFFAWAVSENRRKLAWRTILAGAALQFLLAAMFLKIPLFKRVFMALNDAVGAIEKATQGGTAFVFGYLGGGPAPFATTYPEASFVLAFRALPLILVVSALSSLLFYWRVLPIVVKAFSRMLEKAMGIGGAVGLGAAANVFVGMVEAPLLVRPYLAQMSRSELFITMSCGMAGVAGTVMVLYASILKLVVPDAMGHILIASIVSAPAAIVVSVLMVPPERAMTAGELVPPRSARSSMDAVTQGTTEGIKLLINVVAMLVVLVALVHLANQVLGLAPDLNGKALTLQGVLGWIMAPVVWLVGVPWSEAPTAGALMGTKTVLNELVAYLDLARLTDAELSVRSRLLMTYALCGFANLGSLGILIGGMGAMVPERRDEIVSLGGKSIVAGTLATCLTGATVGVLV